MPNTKITDLTDGNPALTGDEIPISRSAADGDITAGSIASVGAAGVSTSGRLIAMQVYTVVGANTWTMPAGLSYIIVEVQGGGGGGAGSSVGGGGGGGYCRRKIAAASLGASETVTVGSGAAAGGTGGLGNAGGASSFGTTAFLTGCGGSPPNAIFAATFPGGCGGAATSGDVNIKGGSSPAVVDIYTTGGTQLSNMPGRGGTSYFGGGGTSRPQGVLAASGSGVAGRAYGSGGGSGVGAGGTQGAGGAGAQGVVIVWEYI